MDLETNLHVFKDCSYARFFWAVSLIPNNIIVADSNNMCEWIEVARSRASTDEFELFVCFCWILWNNRNMKVHEHCIYDPMAQLFHPRSATTF